MKIQKTMENNSIIETRHLSFAIGSTEILKDVSLSVPKGSLFGFLGPNGAGKSTTIHCITGIA
ncbi:MAG TPA: ATP-binding cassette domain-containing protein, partial [Tenuifilaceae bacterium]|nr:ATP-binding cassette domain-containing protein [Tenuifilaceae bacterium]